MKVQSQAVEIVAVAGAQVVEHADFLRHALIVFDDVGADEAGSAGDEDFHDECLHVRITDAATISSMAAMLFSMAATKANWLRQRSRLWPRALDLEIDVALQVVGEETDAALPG